MAAKSKGTVVVNPFRAGEPLNRAETCTTADCTAPRIRLNALKCTAHEIVYRAAAKERAKARKAAAAANAPATPATTAAKPRKGTKANALPANVAANGLRTTRPPRPAPVATA